MSAGVTRPVGSNQCRVHPRLQEAVAKHRARPWSPPVAAHTRAAFERWLERSVGDARPLMLDSGCGNGESTLALARLFPDHAVLGVDRSEKRLAARGDDPRFVRAELAQFWHLARRAGVRLARHCVFYPNPWPKSVHYLRRWHAHPAFDDLLALGGALELRTNWRIYAEEFALALRASGVASELSILEVETPVSPFERKYARAGHSLWRVTGLLPPLAGERRDGGAFEAQSHTAPPPNPPPQAGEGYRGVTARPR